MRVKNISKLVAGGAFVVVLFFVCMTWRSKIDESFRSGLQPSDSPQRRPNRESTGAEVDLLNMARLCSNKSSQEQRSAGIGKLDLALSRMNEQQLTALSEQYKCTDNESEQLLLSRLLRALFAKNSGAALDCYAQANIALGGLGVGFLEDAIAANTNGLVNWMLEEDLGATKMDVLQSLCIVLGRMGRESVVELIRKQDAGTGSRMAATIFQNFGGSFEEAGLLATQLDGAAKADAILGIASRFQKKFPLQCFELLTNASADGTELLPMAGHTYIGLFKSLFEADGAQALECMGKVDVSRLQSLFSNRDLLASAMKCDMAATSALLGRIVPTKSNAGIFMQATDLMGMKDPKGAFEWSRAIPGGGSEFRSKLEGRAAEMWAQKDFDAAQSACLDLPEAERTGVIQGLARAATLKSVTFFEATVSWAGQLGNTGRSTYVRAAAEYLSVSDPAAAAGLLEGAVAAGIADEDRDQASRVIGSNYAKRLGFASALQWSATLPTATQPAAIGGVMEHWAVSDPAAASGWLAAQPQGPARESGVRVLIQQIKDTDPEMAEQWRKTLPPPVK